MDVLFGQMGLTERRLSEQVKEETVTHGAEVFQPKLSKKIRGKADYILR